MSVYQVTEEQKTDLEDLLSTSAEHWLGQENVVSLAEYGAFIQFTLRKEGEQEKGRNSSRRV